MNTVDWIRRFKNELILKINSEAHWSREDLTTEMLKIYQKVLDEMLDPKFDKKEEK